MLLKLGSSGEEVKTLQMTLNLRGYSIGSAGPDGVFGKDTEKAVKEFQADHNLESDGVVGPATQEALHHDYSGNTDYGELIKIGSSGPQVAEMQRLLIKSGFSVGSAGADGIFGAGTESAVKRFQGSKGLESDGIVGPATWSALRGGTSSELLKLGSRGESVREAQNLLIKSGFSVGSYGADGVFGGGTESAVRRFQGSKGLDKDGIIGPATWSALRGGSVESGLLRLGSRGESVRQLQELLIKAGYSVGSYGADGVFGGGTESAVRRFQESKGLDKDGIVGPVTWGALYGSGGNTVHVSGGPGVLKFVRVAEAQEFHERLNSKGEGDNINPYGAWYGMNGVSWCAIFVSWCANQAGILGSIVPRYHYCENAVNWYRSIGRYRTRPSGYIPKIGDVIFFYDASKPAPFYHTGIVTGYENGEVITTEGNAGHAVRHNLRYSRNYWRIHGYGDNGGILKPNYTQKEIGEAISKVGFAKILGISYKKDVDERTIIRGPLKIKLKTGFSKTLGNPDGKITLAKGELQVEVTNKNCGLSADFIRERLKNLIGNGFSFSGLKEVFYNASVKFQVNSINPAKITLEMETKIFSDELTVYQTAEIEVIDGNFDTNHYSKLEEELYGLIGTLLTSLAGVAEVVVNLYNSLKGSAIDILQIIFNFLKSLPVIPL